jgi:hypothetical protein
MRLYSLLRFIISTFSFLPIFISFAPPPILSSSFYSFFIFLSISSVSLHLYIFDFLFFNLNAQYIRDVILYRQIHTISSKNIRYRHKLSYRYITLIYEEIWR